MPNFIDAWRKDTGEKLPHRIPDTWIRDGINPNLTDAPPTPTAEEPPTTSQEA